MVASRRELKPFFFESLNFLFSFIFILADNKRETLFLTITIEVHAVVACLCVFT